MGKVQKEGRWVSHELSEDNKNRQRDTALPLISKLRKKGFLHKIITGDEKSILYDNPKRRKSWVDPYGVQLWGTASNSNIEIIQRFQNKYFRIIVNALWYVTNDTLHHDFNVPLEMRLKSSVRHTPTD